MNTRRWTTHDGRKLQIKDMSDQHLQSTISLLERAAMRKRDMRVAFYLNCDQPNGEMAMDAFEQECEEAFASDWTDYLPGIYDDMVSEQARRAVALENVKP